MLGVLLLAVILMFVACSGSDKGGKGGGSGRAVNGGWEAVNGGS